MRIAFLVNEFPVISETFVLDQITGMIDRGCAVDIYARRVLDEGLEHPEIAAYGLRDHVFQLAAPMASSELARILRALREIARAFLRRPGVVARALNPAWFGTSVLSFEPFYRVLPFIRQRPYDVMHCHFGPNGMLGVELRDSGAIGVPVVTQFHGYDASSYVQRNGTTVYNHLFAQGDLFLCVSKRIAEALIALGCDARKLRVHHTGVRVKSIPFAPKGLKTGEPVRLLTVGRLVEKKGVEFGLRAVARLLRDYPDLDYTIIGDGPERPSLTNLARDLGVGGSVKLVGAQTRETVAAMMAGADILLAPSVAARDGDEEGIPVVLMEALAAGLPVVSTFHAGISELIAHGVSGLLAPERDAEALADHVRFLITHPSERQAMVAAGRRAVEAEFDVDALNAQLLAHYKEIAGANGAHSAQGSR